VTQASRTFSKKSRCCIAKRWISDSILPIATSSNWTCNIIITQWRSNPQCTRHSNINWCQLFTSCWSFY